MDRDEQQTPNAAGKPSQAEGERDPGSSSGSTTTESSSSTSSKPSQAEGEREQIEEDLGEQ